MAWLVAIVVILLLFVSSGFRKVALGLVALVAIVAVASYITNQQEKVAARSRIALSQLAFDGVSLKSEFGGYKLVGRIKNNSKTFALSNLELTVTMRDCPTEIESASCITIGEDKGYLFLDVPAGQARDFDKSLYFSGTTLKPKGLLVWSYAIAVIEAK